MEILVIDPTPSGLRLQQALRGEGYRVATADGYEEALDYVRARRPATVIMEWKLEGRTGLEVLTEIVRSHPTTRVVVATAYGSIRAAQQAIRAGADDFLTKPVTPLQLLRPFADLRHHVSTEWLTLEAARREYILDVLELRGSTADAARVLCLDRRSLRRMLHRFSSRPPRPGTLSEGPRER